MAIDAFAPDVPVDLKESEFFDLVSARVKEAIKDTQETRNHLSKTLAAKPSSLLLLGVGKEIKDLSVIEALQRLLWCLQNNNKASSSCYDNPES